MSMRNFKVLIQIFKIFDPSARRFSEEKPLLDNG